MKRLFVALSLVLCVIPPALADWDPELEAQEEAERAAAKRAEDARRQEAEAMRRAAEAKAEAQMMADRRKYLGAEANGKSDAEVRRLYDAKVAAKTAEANRVAAEGIRKANSPEARAAVKDVTGHSMQDIQNMSDEELDALSREMEKKYGN